MAGSIEVDKGVGIQETVIEIRLSSTASAARRLVCFHIGLYIERKFIYVRMDPVN